MKPINLNYLFWIRKSRAKNNKAPLYLRIIYKGKRKEINLNHNLDPSIWDSDSHRAMGRSPEARATNQVIFKSIDRIEQILFEYESENKLLTLETFKTLFYGEEPEEENLLGFVDYHNAKMKNVLAPGTLKNYRTTKKYFKSFINQKKKRENIYLREINYKFAIEFESFLRNKPNLNNNGIMKHMERFKKLMNFAHSLELIEKNPVEKFKLKFTKTEVAYLTKDELKKIEEKELTKDALSINRDMFVFSCYTGLAYADLRNLTQENIHKGIDGRNWIYFQRQKSKTNVRVPLLKKAQDIVNKYKDHPRAETMQRLLPVYSNQKTNKYLKEVAVLAKIDKQISFHTARHTFATTVTLSNGISMETVSKLLGHNKLATTQIYARVLDHKISDELSGLEEKLALKDKLKKVN